MENSRIKWLEIKHFILDYKQRKCVFIDSKGLVHRKSFHSIEEYEDMKQQWEWVLADKQTERFDYPNYLIRKKLFDVVMLAFFATICTMVAMFFFIIRPISEIQRVTAFLCIAPWPILSLIMCLVTFRLPQIYTKIEIKENCLTVTYFDGKVLRYSVNDITRCCFDENAINNFIHFTDGRKIVRLQNLSYAPAFRREMASLIIRTGGLVENEFKTKGGIVKCFVRRGG